MVIITMRWPELRYIDQVILTMTSGHSDKDRVCVALICVDKCCGHFNVVVILTMTTGHCNEDLVYLCDMICVES